MEEKDPDFGRQMASEAKKAAGDAAKQIAKKVALSIVTNPIFWMIIAAIILIGAIVSALDIFKSSNTNSAKKKILADSTGIFSIDKSVWGNYNYKYNYLTDEEEIQVNHSLEQLGLNPNNFTKEEKAILGKMMGGYLRGQGGEEDLDLMQYHGEPEYVEAQLKCLVLFVKTELVTMFPDLGGSGSLQGKLHIIREGKSKLKYLPQEEFDKELEKNTESILLYYTLDENNNNIIVAGKTTTQIVYNYSVGYPLDKESNTYDVTYNTIEIPYKSLITKYAIPFEFLQSILTITKQPEFCEEIANKIYNETSIDFKIYDDITTIVDTYKESTKLDYDAKYSYYIEYDYIKNGVSYLDQQYTYTGYRQPLSEDYWYKVESTIETTVPKGKIESAQTAFFNVLQKCAKNPITEEKTSDSNTTTIPDANNPDAEKLPIDPIREQLSFLEQVGLYDNRRNDVTTLLGNRTGGVIINIDFKIPNPSSYKEKYMTGKSVTRESTYNRSGTEWTISNRKEDSITEFKGPGDNGFYDIFAKEGDAYKTARSNIQQQEESLYEMFKNDIIPPENFINIMKYMIFLYSEKNHGVTNINDILKLYKEDEFLTIRGRKWFSIMA